MYHHIDDFLQFIKCKTLFLLGCPEYFFRFRFISLKVRNFNLNSFTFNLKLNLRLKLKLKSAYHAFRSSELIVIFEFSSHTPNYTVLCRNLSAPCLIHFHSSNLAYTVFSLSNYLQDIYLSYPKLPFLFLSFLPSFYMYLFICFRLSFYITCFFHFSFSLIFPFVYLLIYCYATSTFHALPYAIHLHAH